MTTNWNTVGREKVLQKSLKLAIKLGFVCQQIEKFNPIYPTLTYIDWFENGVRRASLICRGISVVVALWRINPRIIVN
jgi:hypothetical protein